MHHFAYYWNAGIIVYYYINQRRTLDKHSVLIALSVWATYLYHKFLVLHTPLPSIGSNSLLF
jgi:hypothetical protein